MSITAPNNPRTTNPVARFIRAVTNSSPFWSLLVWAALWEVVGQLGFIDLIPPLSSVVVAMGDLFERQSFWDALWLTARTFAIGLLLSIVVGIPIGLLMGLRKRADQLLSMWVNLFLSAPLTAVVPALMPLLGIGEATIIATVFLFAVWVVILDTQAGVLHVSPSLVEMGRVFGARKRTIIWSIVVPAAMPEIMTGIRLAVIRAVKGVIVGQIIIALIGFGGLFDTYLSMFLMERFWALIIVVFVLSFTLIGIVGLLERRIAFYAGTR
ncbi:MAG: ABC transporter permease subunit [Devosia sp.]